MIIKDSPIVEDIRRIRKKISQKFDRCLLAKRSSFTSSKEKCSMH